MLRLSASTANLPNTPWRILAISTVLLVAGVINTELTLIFGANDDLGMKSFSNGSYTGNFESKLVFVSQLVGILLKALYTAFPGFGWYDILLVACNVLTFSVLTFKLATSQIGRFTWFFLLITIYIWILLNPNYSSTAAMSAITGALVVGASSRHRLGDLLLGGFLLLIGIGWRLEAAQLALIFLLVAVSVNVLLSHESVRSSWRENTLTVVALLAPLLVSNLLVISVEQSCFADKEVCNEWSTFSAYNEDRGSFHGSARGLYITGLDKSEAVWSQDEKDLFFGWNYFNEQVHGSESLAELDLLYPDPLLPKLEVPQGDLGSRILSTFAKPFVSIFSDYASSFSFMALFWLLPILLSQQMDPRRLFGIGMLSSAPIVSMLLIFTINPQEYILIPTIAGFGLAVALFHQEIRPQFRASSLPSVGVPGKVAALLLAAFAFYIDVKHISYYGLAPFPNSPTLIFVITLLFIVLFERRYSSRKWLGLGMGIAIKFVLVATTFLFPWGLVEEIGAGATKKSEYAALTASFIDYQQASGNIPVFAGGTWGSDFQSPLSFDQTELLPRGIIFGGWTNFSPHWDSRLAMLGLPNPLDSEDFLSGRINYLGTWEQAVWFRDRAFSELPSPRIVKVWKLDSLASVWAFRQ